VPLVLGRRDIPHDAAVRRPPRPFLQRAGDDLPAVLAELRGLGFHRVFVEGGPALASAFLRAGLVDDVIVYVAPVLLGGARLALGEIGVPTIGSALRLDTVSIDPLGDDVRIIAHPSSATADPTKGA
jgi:diaminohydroxyphosphoribosylaminopyrimidine deaminase/5-amino-6-(5-phosphoribosylamino)uracil reductase